MGVYDAIRPVDGVATYEGDFAAWAFEQARRLRGLRANDLDIENIAEEIESLGRSEVAKLESLLAIVVLHLLKWDIQPNLRGRSWLNSVAEHRRQAERHLARNPSLKAVLTDAVDEAFAMARADAIDETGLPDKLFPKRNPYTFETIMRRDLRLDDPE